MSLTSRMSTKTRAIVSINTKWAEHRSFPTKARKLRKNTKATEMWLGNLRDLPRQSRAAEISHLLNSIAAFRAITLEEENFISYAQETIDRTASILSHYTTEAELYNSNFPLPRISPADEGSIDLLWERGDSHFMVNVPFSAEATFYGVAEGVTAWGVLSKDEISLKLISWLVDG